MIILKEGPTVNVENIEERLEEINLYRVYKKREELSSQEYDKDRTVQYKNRKTTLPNITSPAVVEICEVRYEYNDNSSPAGMEDCVNDNLDETHRYIYEHNIETNTNATKMVIEKYLDGHDDDEEKNIREHKKR